MADPRVFTIPASAPFVPTLISALLDGRLVAGLPPRRDPLALAGATLYLPTRRACRLVRDRFLDVTGGEAARPPPREGAGAAAEGEPPFARGERPAGAALGCPPAIGVPGGRLVWAWLTPRGAQTPERRVEGPPPLVATSPAAALALADD